jgi:hypothetical protein
LKYAAHGFPTSLQFNRQCGRRHLQAGAIMATCQRLQPPGESLGCLIAMPGNVSEGFEKSPTQPA